MDVKVAAMNTKKVMKQSNWRNTSVMENNNRPAADFNHVKWMLDGIVLGYIQDEKAHRWLSWAQGVIYACQVSVDLDMFKKINKET